jgi:transcriptional regulator with XRE-family HTH domain
MSQSLADFARGQIRAEMARQELTAGQLAARLGVSDMWVSRRLRGLTPIAVDELEQIANALNLPVSIFLERSAA